MWARQVVQDLWEHLVELEGKKQEGPCTSISKKSRKAATLSADASRKAMRLGSLTGW